MQRASSARSRRGHAKHRSPSPLRRSERLPCSVLGCRSTTDVVTTTTEADSASELETAPTPRRSDRLTAVVAWSVVGIAAVAAGVLLLRRGRGTTWFYDEWSWVLQRRTG